MRYKTPVNIEDLLSVLTQLKKIGYNQVHLEVRVDPIKEIILFHPIALPEVGEGWKDRSNEKPVDPELN